MNGRPKVNACAIEGGRGTIKLHVPQVRDKELSTELFARYQRRELALVLALLETVVNGFSTCKVQQVTEELCGISLSMATVSALYQRFEPLVHAWNKWDLS